MHIYKYAVTYLLWSTILIGELHTFFDKNVVSVLKDGKRVLVEKQPDGSYKEPKRYNWIIARPYPLTLSKNIKDAAGQLIFIIYFVAFYLYGKTPNPVNKATVLSFIAFVTIDGLAYFYNHKTFNYHIVYFAVIVIWIILLIKFKVLKR